MNLNNMSDQELDHLFRESAERYTPPFDPEAWQAMDQMLDTVQGQEGGWFRLYYRYLLLLLLVGIGLVPVFYLSLQPQTQAILPVARQEGQLNQAPASYSSLQKKIAQADNRAQVEPVTQLKPTTQEADSRSINLIEADVPSTAPVKVTNQGKRSLRWLVNQKTPRLMPAPEAKALEEKGKEERANTFREGTQFVSLGLQDSVSRLSEPMLAEKVLNPTPVQNVLQPANPDTLAGEEKASPEAKQAQFLRSVSLMVAAAPDFTTVRLKDAQAVSMNWGLLVAVPLAKKWSLVTGVMYANKKYTTPPEEYTWPSAYANIDYQTVEATCQVLDIPVNLQYQVWEKGQHSVGVAAGLSSYLMLKEEYYSSSPAGYGYGAKTYNWEVDNKNRHWFGVQNISLHYSRAFPSGIALGAEPFVKIPLQGIGAGKVRLTSAGVFFTAGYKFSLKP
ncbi:outer membrane beta-barrel protein [Rufibacter soli]